MSLSAPKPAPVRPAPPAPEREDETIAPHGRPTPELENVIRRTGLRSNIYTSSLGITNSSPRTGSSQLLGIVG